MKKIYECNGKYGKLVIDLKGKKVVVDELNRERIWEDANQDYLQQQYLYSEIIEELFGDDIAKIFPPRHANEYWRGEPTDFGFRAFNDEVEIIVDAQGTFIDEIF